VADRDPARQSAVNVPARPVQQPSEDPVVIVCRDRDAIAARAMDLLIDALRPAILRRGEAHLCLTGGSSAAALFERLRSDPRARRVDWAAVHVWQGDERFVPRSHPDSNWAAALRDWLDPPAAAGVMAAARVPAENWHPIPVEAAMAAGHDESWAAARYGEELARRLPRRTSLGLPAFDAWLLGVGSDGHIFSAFPGGRAIDETEALALGVPAPAHIEPHVSRVTLSPHLLQAAGSIVVMVPGAGKAEIVAECFTAPLDMRRLPAQAALRPNAVWLLEPGSAASL
jgi:6-phosphogluconolactonase